MAKAKKIKAIVTYVAGGKLTPDMFEDESNRKKLPREISSDIREAQKALKAYEGNSAKVAYYLNRLCRPVDADGTKVFQKMGYKTLIDLTADYFNISAGTCRTYASVGEKWIVRDKLGIHSKICTFTLNESGEPTGIDRDFTVSQLQEFGKIPPKVALMMVETDLIDYDSKCAYMRDAGTAVKSIMESVRDSGKFTDFDYTKIRSRILLLVDCLNEAYHLGYNIKPTFAIEMMSHADCFTDDYKFSDKGLEILKAGEFPKAIKSNAKPAEGATKPTEGATKPTDNATTQKGIDNVFDAIRAMQSAFITALRMAKGNDDYVKLLNDAVADNFDVTLKAVDGDYSVLDDTTDDTTDTADTPDDTTDTADTPDDTTDTADTPDDLDDLDDTDTPDDLVTD